MEYEVVWNGAHKNADADLLFAGLPIAAPALPEPVPGQKRQRLGWPSQARSSVFAALPVERDQAVTIGELLARTGSTYAAVHYALFRLRQKGLLETAIVPGRGGQGPRPRLYWRKATA